MSSTQKFAIVGINCRLPGARDAGKYWSNLKAGTESITTWSLEELIDAGIDPEMAKNPGHVKARPSFAEVEKFDARVFRFTPREAEVRDPQHRLFLESMHTASEDTGDDPFSDPGRVGVFAGSAPNAYEPQNVRHHQERVQTVGQMTVSIGNTTDYVAPTVSYKLGLSGPSVNVVTACSSSLVAVHMACPSPMNGECETAVAGGAEVEPTVVSGYWSAEGGIYSKSGHCRPFDHEADGTIFGTGAGTVVLRRLEDAVRDNNIYAVILGSAVNNDAADRAGFTAPSISGQRALMERHQCLRHCRGTAEGADRWQHPSVATVPSVCADRCRSGRRHGEPGEDLRRGIRGLGGFHGCAGCSLGKRMRRNLCPLGSFLLADMSRLSS
ncbi:beta-ketoacyl synthase N-terminal-like domain-containing protein [Streptomyces sp. NPDC021218]|uniref:beta-ketoacyl synthase N-terminal-like domain-containing protein n=1 Tax=Streptomyces sp. NPDC021218 TaxID=3365119 RepID=UPI0037B890AB